MVSSVRHPSVTQRIGAWTQQAKTCAVNLTQNADTFVRTRANTAKQAWHAACDPSNLHPDAGAPFKHRTDLLVAATQVGLLVGVVGCLYASPIRTAVQVLIKGLNCLALAAVADAVLLTLNKSSRTLGAQDLVTNTAKLVKDGTLPEDSPTLRSIYRTWQSAEVAYAKWWYGTANSANDTAPATA